LHNGSAKRFTQANCGVDGVPVSLEHPSPSQIVFQMLGGDTMEAAHPAFQAAVVAIDVLDVQSALDDASALADVDLAMRDADNSGEHCIDSRTFSTRNCILCDKRLQYGNDMRRIHFFASLKSAVCPLRSRTTKTGICSARCPAARRRKRCRHKKAVFLSTLQRLAASRRLMPSINAWL
jgi:hypothetical protein